MKLLLDTHVFLWMVEQQHVVGHMIDKFDCAAISCSYTDFNGVNVFSRNLIFT